MGIKEQILKASSESQIDALLKTAVSYTEASVKTKRSWLRVKQKVTENLKNPGYYKQQADNKQESSDTQPLLVVAKTKKKYKKMKF